MYKFCFILCYVEGRNTHIHYRILNIHVDIYTFTSFYLTNFNKTTFLYKVTVFIT
jgi:hypothetical protein